MSDRLSAFVDGALDRFFEALDDIKANHDATDAEMDSVLRRCCGDEIADGYEQWIADGAE